MIAWVTHVLIIVDDIEDISNLLIYITKNPPGSHQDHCRTPSFSRGDAQPWTVMPTFAKWHDLDALCRWKAIFLCTS